MSVIHAPRPLATGIDTAALALKKAQGRLGGAALEASRQTAAIDASNTKESQSAKPPLQPPPNPGPPGGAVPGDLAQAMVEQKRAASTHPERPDPIGATLTQRVASAEFTANVKTVQAIDAMLEELSRIKQPEPNE